MPASPPPATIAEWVAHRRAAGRPIPAAKPRLSDNFLNIRHAETPENAGNPPNIPSTERLNVTARPAVFNQLVEQRLDATFTALADPTRRAMLAALTGGEKSVGDLAAPYAMSFAGAAKHVGVLERAGLIERRKAGRQQLCRLRTAPLHEADAVLRPWQQCWTARRDMLAALIEEHTP